MKCQVETNQLHVWVYDDDSASVYFHASDSTEVEFKLVTPPPEEAREPYPVLTIRSEGQSLTLFLDQSHFDEIASALAAPSIEKVAS